jgi:hypothetical protein
MKSFYTLVFFLSFSTVSLAQSYIPLLNENLYWDVAAYSQGHICDFHDNLVPERYFIAGDIDFSNKTYKYFSSFRFQPEHGSQPICPPFVIDTIARATGIFLREDILEQKVYRYDTEQNEEYLLFDFSVNIGDSVYIHDFGPTYATINKIDTIQTNDGKLRRRFFHNYELTGESYYIEGIGGVQSFFISPVSFFENGYFTMCVKTRENSEITNENGCYTFTAINDFDNSKIPTLRIYPNQIEDDLTIISAVNQTINIYDLLGNAVYSEVITKGKTVVDLSFLTPQLYIVKGNTVSKKIMKL